MEQPWKILGKCVGVDMCGVHGHGVAWWSFEWASENENDVELLLWPAAAPT